MLSPRPSCVRPGLGDGVTDRNVPPTPVLSMLKFGPQNIVLFGSGVFTEASQLKLCV